MQVPFLHPAAQIAELRAELLSAVTEVLDRGHFILGPQVAAFESEIATWLNVEHAVGVNSGSDALTLALRALEIGSGDEVITTPFTYIAPAESVIQVGAKLVFADINPRTFCLDPSSVAAHWTERTRAVIPVHLFGQAAPMQPLLDLAQSRQAMVIEDCAQAIGARQDDRLVGGQGRIGCFSFYPTKNLGAAGDGGLCVTRDATLAQRLRQLRVHGIERRYHHDLHGYNTRLDEIQAAVLRVKLPHVARWNDQRRKIAERYLDGLSQLPLEMPVTAPGNAHVWHVFAILCEGRQVRDELQTYLAEQGVPTIIYYPVPLHLQRCYADQNWRAGDYPATESVASRILPLPMYPELTEAQVDHVIQSVQGFFKG